MKTRTSFVANSSSSSFIILGNKEELSLDMYPECKYEYTLGDYHSEQTELDVLAVDEDYETFYVGAKIYIGSNHTSMSIEEFEKRINDAKEKLKQKGITDYKVYLGEINS